LRGIGGGWSSCNIGKCMEPSQFWKRVEKKRKFAKFYPPTVV
jgi:hypothetical protein